MSRRLEFALATARAAGDSTLELFRSPPGFEFKSDSTPVTMADRRAEEIVREQIQASYPGETVLGEEEGLVGHSRDRWVVDPIDGTKSFIGGVPLYATLLSWEVDEIPELGVAYFPALDWMVYAERGSGAFSNGHPCRARNAASLRESIICHGSLRALQLQGRLDGFFELASGAMAAKGWGDAYGHALVATGRAQAMIDPVVSRWDISSVSLIVQESGALFTSLDGCDDLGSEGLSVVPSLQARVLEALKA